jgi:hypothetical protein
MKWLSVGQEFIDSWWVLHIDSPIAVSHIVEFCKPIVFHNKMIAKLALVLLLSVSLTESHQCVHDTWFKPKIEELEARRVVAEKPRRLARDSDHTNVQPIRIRFEYMSLDGWTTA